MGKKASLRKQGKVARKGKQEEGQKQAQEEMSNHLLRVYTGPTVIVKGTEITREL